MRLNKVDIFLELFYNEWTYIRVLLNSAFSMRWNKVTKVMGVSIATNIFLSIVKIITGLIGKSSALIADGIHSFSDLSTDFIAIIGNYLSRKPADEKHPYGHGKIEYITSIIISLVILFLGSTIIYSSIQKDIAIPSMIVAIISFLTIALKPLNFGIMTTGNN